MQSNYVESVHIISYCTALYWPYHCVIPCNENCTQIYYNILLLLLHYNIL